jgi:hypothetical protein
MRVLAGAGFTRRKSDLQFCTPSHIIFIQSSRAGKEKGTKGDYFFFANCSNSTPLSRTKLFRNYDLASTADGCYASAGYCKCGHCNP